MAACTTFFQGYIHGDKMVDAAAESFAHLPVAACDGGGKRRKSLLQVEHASARSREAEGSRDRHSRHGYRADRLKKGKIEAREALKQNLEEIDAKAVALKSIKDVSTLPAAGPPSISRRWRSR